MTPHMKWAIGGVIVGLILLGVIPWWIAVALIAAAIAIPAAAYLMLDESQPPNRERCPRARPVAGPGGAFDTPLSFMHVDQRI